MEKNNVSDEISVVKKCVIAVADLLESNLITPEQASKVLRNTVKNL